MMNDNKVSNSVETYTLAWSNLSATIELKHQQSLLDSLKSKLDCNKERNASTIKTIINNGN